MDLPRFSSPPLAGPIAFRFAGRARDLFTGDGVIFFLLLISFFGIPWAIQRGLRWFVSNVDPIHGARARFVGGVGPLWASFGAVLALAVLQQFNIVIAALTSEHPAVGAVLTILWAVLMQVLGTLNGFLITRWECANVESPSGGRLAFSGGFWTWLGWQLLLLVSMLTIVGWAWVSVAQLRWVTRHVRSSSHEGRFSGTGLQMLWRGLVLALGCAGLVTMPVTVCWFVRWLVSQTSGEPRESAYAYSR
ncbi:MAG: hypothetical protein U0Q55_16710 [Vicinamibacterales bacterium]